MHFNRPTASTRAARLSLAAAATVLLCACSGMAGPGAGTALPSGLVARMDQPGARLDRQAALDLVNAYRGTVGAPALTADAGLDSQAQTLADGYARTGTAPSAPAGIVGIKLSAGYPDFAETFSGWRNSSNDARALTDARARRAGLAVAYNAASTYGIHWVLVLDD